MQNSLKIRRKPPTPRNIFKGLVGHLEVDIKSEQYLHIGSGSFTIPASLVHHVKRIALERGRVDNNIIEETSRMMDSTHLEFATLKERLIIPGASVKGNIRARLELSFVPVSGTIASCFRVSGNKPPPQGWRHARIWEKAVRQNRGNPCSLVVGEKHDRNTDKHGLFEQQGARSEETQEVCIVCDMFGAPGLVGLVEFTDFLGPPASDAVVVKLKPYGEKLKAAKPGSVFSGQIYFRNLSPVMLGLLFYGMGLREGCEGRRVLLGKHKYKRCGRSGHVFGVVRYSLKKLVLSELSSRLEASGIVLEPGGEARGDLLGRIVKALVAVVKAEYKDELLDVDEVGRLEQLGSRT